MCPRLLLRDPSLVRVLAVSDLKKPLAELTRLLFLFGMLLDGLLQKGWVKGFVVEPANAVFQPFVTEQGQLQQHSTNYRLDVGHILSFCVSQAGYRAG